MKPNQRSVIDAKLNQARGIVKVFKENLAREKAKNRKPATPNPNSQKEK